MKFSAETARSAAVGAAMFAVAAATIILFPDATFPFPREAHTAGTGFAAVVLFILPALSVLVTLIFAILPAKMRRANELSRSIGPYLILWQTVLGALLVLQLLLVAAISGVHLDLVRACVLVAGALLARAGNLVPKIRFNSAFGVRTPWTLADECVWDRSHRVAGALFLVAGLVAIAGAVLIREQLLMILGLAIPTLAAVMLSFVYPIIISPRRMRGF